MTRYHISPDGEARACSAAKACRYGSDVPHFSTAEDARTAYEASRAGSFTPEKLTKKAYEKDRTFTFHGAKLDSSYWLYSDGSGGWGKAEPSVSLVADEREYRPEFSWGMWSAKVNRQYANNGGWGSMKGTKSFKDFKDLVKHVEDLALTRARQKLKNPDMTKDELLRHLREEKLRYDKLDEELS